MRKTVSGIILILLLTSMLTLAFNIQPVKAEGTIYIRADGSIDPPTVPIQRDGDIYTFIDNINGSIVVQRSSIIIDGAGYTLLGSGSGTGFSCPGIYDVTIKHTNILNFSSGAGISLDFSSNNSISGNNIEGPGFGIVLDHSSNNSIGGNNITNAFVGMPIDYSSQNTISGNNITEEFRLACSSDNTISRNNMAYGDVYDYSWDYPQYSPSINVWDDGYPSGGNYGSDYIDVDLYSGPYQNETGSDGIWDHPYVIDANNQDRYPLANPWTPTPTYVQGIDVSHYQGTIDWSQVYGAGYRFAFVKASEGFGWEDPLLIANMDNGLEAGLLMGAYHLARPDLGYGGVEEAILFLSFARDYIKNGYLRPVLRLSTGSSLGIDELSEWVIRWMDTVKDDTSVEPVIQVNSDYANYYLNASIAQYDLWITDWTYDPSASPGIGIWSDWSFWQYSDLGSVPGISGNVFLNIFNGDLNGLYAKSAIYAELSSSVDWVSNNRPAEGEPVQIRLRIENTGTMKSSQGYVQLLQKTWSTELTSGGWDALVGNYSLPELSPKESKNFEFTWYAVEIKNDDMTKCLQVFTKAGDVSRLEYVNVLEVNDKSPFDVSRNGFSFPNWPFIDVELRELKSKTLDYLSRYVPNRIAKALENYLWDSITIGGHCYGMASASAVYFKEQSKVAFDVSKEEAEADITLYHLEQIPALILLGRNVLFGMNLREEYNKIVQNLQQNQPVILCMSFRDNPSNAFKTQHAMTVFNVYDISEDKKNVLVYDNEFPGTAVVFTFNLEDNTVSCPILDVYGQPYYGGIKSVYVGQPGPYQGVAIKRILSEFLQDLKNGWKEILNFNCPVNVSITDEFGRTISEVDNQIPDATYQYCSLTDTKTFYLPSNLTYNVLINATGYGNCTITHITPTESLYATDFSIALFNLTDETSALFHLEPYNANYTLKLDENSDGFIDRELTPEEAVLDFEYDVGISEILSPKTVVGQDYDLPINVTIMNYGAYDELFNVTAYANTTMIGTQMVALASGSFTTITFTWNTTGFAKGNYTLWSYAEPVQGETFTSDNNSTDGWVTVTIPGDVNGDFKCDGKDIAMIAKAYGSLEGQPAYVPNADINGDGRIDGKDIAVAAKYYGTHYP